jgi:hypothetical protein
MNYMYAAITGFIKNEHTMHPSHMTVQPHEHDEINILCSKRIYTPFLALKYIFYIWGTLWSKVTAFNS